MAQGSTTSSSIGNLPISISHDFTSDDIALIIGTCSPEAVFVIDAETNNIAAGNLKFLSLVGIDSDFFGAREISWDRLVHPEDRAIFNTWRASVLQGEEGDFELRLSKRDSVSIPASVHLKNLRWKRRTYLIGFVHEISALEERRAQLKKQVDEQKERAFEAIRSSLRLYQFNEKIKRTPLLAQRLLNIENEQELFSEAAKILTSEEGLNYRDATFLIMEGNVLRVVFSTRELQEREYPLSEDNRFSRFIRHSFPSDDETGHGILIALQSRGQLLGMCEVTSHPKEKLFFEESHMVIEWQRDVLQDIGGIIALLIDNLRLNREVKRQSIIDSLTQTYNRHHFVGRLASEVHRAQRYARPASVVFLDIDNFKLINDKHGHLQGDQVLREMAGLFLENLREIDVVCRFGGDEFIILLPETDADMACRTAEKLLNAVREHAFKNLEAPGETLPATISIGVSTLVSGQNEEQLLKAADTALYKAKRLGRNQVVVYSENPSAGMPI